VVTVQCLPPSTGLPRRVASHRRTRPLPESLVPSKSPLPEGGIETPIRFALGRWSRASCFFAMPAAVRPTEVGPPQIRSSAVLKAYATRKGIQEKELAAYSLISVGCRKREVEGASLSQFRFQPDGRRSALRCACKARVRGPYQSLPSEYRDG